MPIHYHGLSDVGLVRTNNEDSWFASPDGRVFLVADGLGGHQAGEVASKEAVDSFLSVFLDQFPPDNPKEVPEAIVLSRLKYCFQFVNQRLFALSSTHDLLKGMGTTLCSVSFHGKMAAIAHVGDSRVYLHRNGELVQITTDHCSNTPPSLASRAESLFTKGFLTRALGTVESIEPDISFIPIEEHDCFLLCTDGLSDMLSHDEIESAINQPRTVGERVRLLTSYAKQKGGADNITLILVEISP